MMPSTLSAAQIPGWTLLRVLSEREGSSVYLAKDSRSVFRALKLQQPARGTEPEALLARYALLQNLTSLPGLLPLLAFGCLEEAQFWESLALADNLPGLPSLDAERGIEQYTPVTLRSRTTEQGPAPAGTVIRWGIRLASALARLHGAGLVHRDIKPANIIFLEGEPSLGDYGLVGKPGSAFEFSGTEGFQPLEGTNEAAGDLFALGKALYEAWTANDRLEFPSLPRAVLDSKEWRGSGRHLNEVLLRACDACPGRRFASAEHLAEALAEAAAGRPKCRRRRFLKLTAAFGAAGATGVWLFKPQRAPAKLIWRRLREKGLSAELWEGHSRTVDWQRRKIFSIAEHRGSCIYQSFDLDNFTRTEAMLEVRLADTLATILHPETRQLWGITGGRGEVLAVDVDTRKVSSLGGGPHDGRHFGASTYWNPITRRVGVVGGYGLMAVTNDRSEFDSEVRKWIELEPDAETDTRPWRRQPPPVVPNTTGERLYLLGGNGSPSGKQGVVAPGLPHFDGRFHVLDDLWELDLREGKWRRLLPLGSFDVLSLSGAVYHPAVSGLLIFEGPRLLEAASSPKRAFLFRPDIETVPVQLPLEGQTPKVVGAYWCCTIDPATQEIVVLASDGIFRVSVQTR